MTITLFSYILKSPFGILNKTIRRDQVGCEMLNKKSITSNPNYMFLDTFMKLMAFKKIMIQHL
jgi:hypothetical protein